MTNEAIEAAALLPCPFCGGNEITATPPPYPWGFKCAGCRVQVTLADTEAEAIAAWNTRAAAPALMEEGEKAGHRKAAKQIADWLREWGEDHLANQIEEGAPFQ